MQKPFRKIVENLGIDSTKSEYSTAEVEAIMLSIGAGVGDSSSMPGSLASGVDAKVTAAATSFPGPIYWVSEGLCYLGVNKNIPYDGKVDLGSIIGEPVGVLNYDQFLIPVLTGLFQSDLDNYSWDAKFLRDGRPRWFQMFASKYADGKAIVVFGFDITGRRELELELLQSREDLESSLERLNDSNTRLSYAQKMEALGEMADAVSHEINNPLAIINGRASLLMDFLDRDKFDEGQFRKFIESICRTSHRIAKIVGSLKTFANTSQGDEIANYSVRNILERAIMSLQEELGLEEIVCTIEDQGVVAVAECRPTQLVMAFSNLIRNSLYAVRSSREKWINISIDHVGADIQVCITDAGSGISRELALKIFQPFYTTKEIGQGAGLGLSVVKGIMDDHGGAVGIDFSCENTKFVLSLPKSKNKPEDFCKLDDPKQGGKEKAEFVAEAKKLSNAS